MVFLAMRGGEFGHQKPSVYLCGSKAIDKVTIHLTLILLNELTRIGLPQLCYYGVCAGYNE